MDDQDGPVEMPRPGRKSCMVAVLDARYKLEVSLDCVPGYIRSESRQSRSIRHPHGLPIRTFTSLDVNLFMYIRNSPPAQASHVRMHIVGVYSANEVLTFL